MYSIVLFGEDKAHQIIIENFIIRLADEAGVSVQLDWRSHTGGDRYAMKLRVYMDQLTRSRESYPDLIVVVIDSNCAGYLKRSTDVLDRISGTYKGEIATIPVVIVSPDPHIERWLLLDSQAFKEVLGKGCLAPDFKCERYRYKNLLAEAIREAEKDTNLSGIEFAEDIVKSMNIERVMRADDSFRRFVEDVRKVFKQWEISD